MTLFGKPEDQEDHRLMSQNNSLIGVWMPGPFIEQRWGEVRKQSKKTINLPNISQNGRAGARDMLIYSFLPPTGGQGAEHKHCNSQAEEQDSLRQTTMYDYNNKSNEKQVNEV